MRQAGENRSFFAAKMDKVVSGGRSPHDADRSPSARRSNLKEQGEKGKFDTYDHLDQDIMFRKSPKRPASGSLL